MRAMDVLMSFPPILLGLLILAVTHAGAVEGHHRRRHRLCPAIVRITRSVTLDLARRNSF